MTEFSKQSAIQIGDEFVTQNYPENMTKDIANAKKFTTIGDVFVFVKERNIPGLIFQNDFKFATLGFVVVPIPPSHFDEIERRKCEEWAGMPTEERKQTLTFKARSEPRLPGKTPNPPEKP